MPICAKCQLFPTEWPCSNLVTFDHHETFRDLDQSAANGCALCRIVRQLLVFEAETNQLWNTSCPVVVQISGPSSISISLGEEDADDDFAVSAYGILEIIGNPQSASNITSLLAANQAREVQHIVNSIVRPWVTECCESTAKMQASKNALLPTRVIDVESGQDCVRLVETNGQRGIYLILSYCWGKGNDRIKTTRLNFEQRKKTLYTKDLPPTIRQAVEISKQLGIRHLWVDAICIIQAHSVPPQSDELEDWRREAPNMSQYYSNAILTLAASAATDSDHGFLSERSSQKYPVSPYKIGVWNRDPEIGSDAFVLPSKPSVLKQVHYAPLYSRGWTLQERVLSHHTLHWCRESIFWECQGNLKASEFEPALRSEQSKHEDQGYIWAVALSQPRDSPYYTNEFWLDGVEEYCGMNLSYETDRLMAIQGLVDQLQSSNNQDEAYVAGIFKSGIIDGLSWSNHNPQTNKVTAFPSWSWASLSAGNLSFRHLSGKFATLKSAINFDITGRDANQNGRLQMAGPIRKLHTSVLRNESVSQIAVIDKAYPFTIYFNFDTVSRTPAYSGDILLFALGWQVISVAAKDDQGYPEIIREDRLVVGLVLVETAVGSAEYKRIGAFEVQETAMSTEWDLRTKVPISIL
ncbi:hypothetical protein ACHAQJ_006510 [Trichoderma viride]